MAKSKIFKTILSALATMLLAIPFAACSDYKPPQGPGSGDPETPPTGPVEPVDPIEPDLPDDAFTVKLEYISLGEGKQDFTSETYRNITNLQVQWTNKETREVYRSSFNNNGIAANTKLDGEYKVTLVTLPNGYTYNPNIYEASTDIRNITVTLYVITPLQPQGKYGLTGESWYKADVSGAYSVTLESAEDSKLVEYKTGFAGIFSIRSLVDVTANEVNPRVDLMYSHLPAYLNDPFATQDGGGEENTYTKNFLYEYSIPSQEVGNGLALRIWSTGINANAYPMTVDFIIDRDGDFLVKYDRPPSVPVTEDFTKTPATPAGTFTYCAYRHEDGSNLLNQKEVALNPDDGYYYYVTENPAYNPAFDEEKDKYIYVDRLYAKFVGPNEVVDTLSGGLQGLHYVNNYDYTSFFSIYSSHCNGGGYYPVNEEVKTFLQNFSLWQRYFNDGNGYAETHAGYNSDEDSQWMFACGWYK